MKHQQNLTTYLHAFISELASNGVEHAVISPGSRSTPISLLMVEEERMNVHVHVDERSAAFFALGIAKVTKKPTVLVCTSGTAAANYFPAIVEAKISRIPLIIITADRPHELRDVGAPQAIDQIDLYGKHVKWFMEMSPPDGDNSMVRYVKTIGARAVATSIQRPNGPVHLNLPIREPLIPDLENIQEYKEKDKTVKSISIKTGDSIVSDSYFIDLSQDITQYRNGIIVCGEMDNPDFSNKVRELAKVTGYPILADPLSNLRSDAGQMEFIIDTYDTFLRNDGMKQILSPEIVLRFGSMPISKPLTIFLRENAKAKQVVIDGGSGFRDPNQLTSEMVYCDESYFCENVIHFIKDCSMNHYLDKWKEVNSKTKEELMQVEGIQELSEAKLFKKLAELIPDQAALFVGNSMPIRDLDTFFHHQKKSVTIIANRGANGIDGTISTALGVAMVKKPLFLVVGDLTFFHDMNALMIAKQYDIPITILLINNNGGGIFSFLPQANLPRHFELLFGTPLHIDFKHLVTMYKGEYELISDWSHLINLFQHSNFTSGIRVWELQTNRDENLLEHRNIMGNIAEVLEKSFAKGDSIDS
ncbi:2-succinyl-5-enolpyruvyl-6-hydroxy-3-cyclohexene-1-carboxylic-acid synthase [Bacillus sp. B1-b2]|uniref:2-succinyl-5-enolpyruvyl-6-hydroxy-3- cyclohexene-1-carboxylic-acid synthase n=1 Tax=Bacillus sp. B1-b2 TaxID=2653201 RepID=UPI001262591E|nr:2-succinyl-5-enolpyruvyl-6-hydroxy-3-cyclohexene-1-carboxylic-acid synthase [Bacillus sp. B1-b2]KAB7666824.1 2-succinyl-5-enolpyruvyl-6-hydroxy-3-cyclohexene-1-carboxylic-acid synthase [Bacillus sp. B1-b2]